MSEQVLKSGNVMERSRTRTITQIAMLGALAGILMNFEFPLPFLAPSFYQLDFSEIPVLVGAFAMGPIAGIQMCIRDRIRPCAAAPGSALIKVRIFIFQFLLIAQKARKDNSFPAACINL